MSNTDPNSPHERFDARLQRRSSIALKARILQAERSSLEQMAVKFGTDVAIERAAALIVKARRRFIYGAAKSYGYAALMANDMDSSLTHVHLVDGTVNSALDLLSDVRSSDVLVVFSLRRYRRDVVEVATKFKEAGGVLIAITDSLDAPLVAVADEFVVVDTHSESYVDSSLGIVLALHLLSALTAASSKGAGRRLLERDKLSAELNLYIGD